MKEPERPCPVWPSMAYSSKAGRLYEKQYFRARPVGGDSGVDLDSFFLILASCCLPTQKSLTHEHQAGILSVALLLFH